MSSILDALNKAEQERAAAEDALARGFDDLDAEDELVGRKPNNGSHKRGMTLTPLKMMLLGLTFVSVIAAASGGAALVVLNFGGSSAHMPLSAETARPDQLEQSPAAPVTPASREVQTAQRPVFMETPAATDDTDETESGGAVSDTMNVASVPATAPQIPEAVSAGPSEVLPAARAPKPEDSPEPPAATGWRETPQFNGTPAPPREKPAETMAELQWSAMPDPEPARPAPRAQTARVEPRPVYTTPEPEPARVLARDMHTSPVEYEAPSERPPAAPRSADSGPSRTQAGSVADNEVDILSLPELTLSVSARLGLPEITVNVVGRPSRYRPQPSAMINFNRVLLNDYIPGTEARLIGVSVHGIGIDVRGERYFVPK